MINPGFVQTPQPSAALLQSAQNLDAFGRMRVSNTKTLFDSVHSYNLSPFFWDEITATGGTVAYTSNANKAVLTCTASDGSRAVHQTHNYLRYQPAKSQYIKCTAKFGSGDLYVVQRSSVGGSVSESRVAQASFNRDSINSNGGSGFNIDTTKANIYTIDFQYLGVGFARFGTVGSDGSLIAAHMIENANNNTGLYMLTAMLPFRVEVVVDSDVTYKRMGYFDDNDGLFWEVQTTGADSMDFFCCSIESEGGQNIAEERGLPFSYAMTTEKTIDSGFDPLLSIRPKATFQSKTNRGLIVPTELAAIIGARDVDVRIVLNGSLTGASFQSVNDESIAEYDVSATAISDGYIVKAFPLEADANIALGAEGLLSRLALSLDAAGSTADVLTVCAQRPSQNTTGKFSFDWKELY